MARSCCRCCRAHAFGCQGRRKKGLCHVGILWTRASMNMSLPHLLSSHWLCGQGCHVIASLQLLIFSEKTCYSMKKALSSPEGLGQWCHAILRSKKSEGEKRIDCSLKVFVRKDIKSFSSFTSSSSPPPAAAAKVVSPTQGPDAPSSGTVKTLGQNKGPCLSRWMDKAPLFCREGVGAKTGKSWLTNQIWGLFCIKRWKGKKENCIVFEPVFSIVTAVYFRARLFLSFCQKKEVRKKMRSIVSTQSQSRADRIHVRNGWAEVDWGLRNGKEEKSWKKRLLTIVLCCFYHLQSWWMWALEAEQREKKEKKQRLRSIPSVYNQGVIGGLFNLLMAVLVVSPQMERLFPQGKVQRDTFFPSLGRGHGEAASFNHPHPHSLMIQTVQGMLKWVVVSSSLGE